MTKKRPTTKKAPPAKQRQRAKLKPAGPMPKIADDLQRLRWPVEELQLDPQNAKKHNEQNVRAIAASLHSLGQRKPIVCNRRNNQVEAGNGTLLAARALGWSHLAVVWVDDDPATQARFSIADNRTAELADWDQTKLAALLEEHAETDRALFDELRIAELFDDTSKPAKGKGSSEPKSPWPTCIYSVVVDCQDETDQNDLSARMEAEGRHCRLLTSVSTAAKKKPAGESATAAASEPEL